MFLIVLFVLLGIFLIIVIFETRSAVRRIEVRLEDMHNILLKIQGESEAHSDEDKESKER